MCLVFFSLYPLARPSFPVGFFTDYDKNKHHSGSVSHHCTCSFFGWLGNSASWSHFTTSSGTGGWGIFPFAFWCHRWRICPHFWWTPLGYIQQYSTPHAMKALLTAGQKRRFSLNRGGWKAVSSLLARIMLPLTSSIARMTQRRVSSTERSISW